MNQDNLLELSSKFFDLLGPRKVKQVVEVKKGSHKYDAQLLC